MKIPAEQCASKTPRNSEQKSLDNVYPPPCVTCHMAHVTCHLSHVTCDVSHVMCEVSQFFSLLYISFIIQTMWVSHATCYVLLVYKLVLVSIYIFFCFVITFLIVFTVVGCFPTTFHQTYSLKKMSFFSSYLLWCVLS